MMAEALLWDEWEVGLADPKIVNVWHCQRVLHSSLIG
jgi:hypothetical protein